MDVYHTGCPFAQNTEPRIPKCEKTPDGFVVAELAYAK